MMALGFGGLLGPVGILILCIGAGLIIGFFAVRALASPVQRWLDRSAFGHHKFPEGPFASQKLEADGLEMIARQLELEMEWHDTALSAKTDQIEIVLKRPLAGADAIVFWLHLHHKSDGKQDRRSNLYRHGLSHEQLTAALVPGQFDKLPLANPAAGAAFEAASRLDKQEYKVTGDNNDKKHQWAEIIEVSTELYQKATLHIRYLPDSQQPDLYFDDQLQIAD